MAIFKKSFFDRRNAAQKAADYSAFEAYMYPLGDEQRKMIRLALQGAPRPGREEEMMFIFLTAKERYIECQMEGSDAARCREEAWKVTRRWRFTNRENLPYIFTLMLLDMDTEELESYPSYHDIYQLMTDLFPGDWKTPDWSALALDRQV